MNISSRVWMVALAIALGSTPLVSREAQALPITGGISLGGGYTTNTGNLNNATAFTSFSGVSVISVSGSYSTVPTFGNPGTPSVTQNGFSFDPFPPGGIVPLWSFTYPTIATTYSFNLTSLTSVLQPGDNTLMLTGSGTLRITGFTDTPGTWIFTANQANSTFSFSSSNGALPEGGSAVALLGLGLVVLEVLRRRLAVC